MAVYIVDTHALLWYLGGSPRLGHAARAVLDDAAVGGSQVLIPAIVLAELIRLSEKRHSLDIQSLVSVLRTAPGFCFPSLTPDIVMGICALGGLPDLHDRLIVSETIAAGAVLITLDKEIIESGLTPVVW